MGNLPQKDLLRPDEVARYFEVNRKTIIRWVNSGELQGINPGGKTLRILRVSVIKLMKNIKEVN